MVYAVQIREMGDQFYKKMRMILVMQPLRYWVEIDPYLPSISSNSEDQLSVCRNIPWNIQSASKSNHAIWRVVLATDYYDTWLEVTIKSDAIHNAIKFIRAKTFKWDSGLGLSKTGGSQVLE